MQNIITEHYLLILKSYKNFVVEHVGDNGLKIQKLLECPDNTIEELGWQSYSTV